MRASEMDIDLSQMKVLESENGRLTELVVTITEKHYFALNGKLKEKLHSDGRDSAVEIRFTEDLKIISIQKKETGITFPKSSRIKRHDFAQELERNGYNLPAKYVIEWNSKAMAWVGILQEVAKAPVLYRKQKRIG